MVLETDKQPIYVIFDKTQADYDYSQIILKICQTHFHLLICFAFAKKKSSSSNVLRHECFMETLQ